MSVQHIKQLVVGKYPDPANRSKRKIAFEAEVYVQVVQNEGHDKKTVLKTCITNSDDITISGAKISQQWADSIGLLVEEGAIDLQLRYEHKANKIKAFLVKTDSDKVKDEGGTRYRFFYPKLGGPAGDTIYLEKMTMEGAVVRTFHQLNVFVKPQPGTQEDCKCKKVDDGADNRFPLKWTLVD